MQASISKTPRHIFLVITAAVLVACGGGEDTPNNGDPIDQYVGLWRGCLKTDVSLWQIVEISTTKATANTGTTMLKGFATYKDAACTTVSRTQDDPVQPAHFTLGDVVQSQGKSAHKVEIAIRGGIKFLWHRSSNQLLISDPDSPTDADGYPTILMNEPLVKQ